MFNRASGMTSPEWLVAWDESGMDLAEGRVIPITVGVLGPEDAPQFAVQPGEHPPIVLDTESFQDLMECFLWAWEEYGAETSLGGSPGPDIPLDEVASFDQITATVSRTLNADLAELGADIDRVGWTSTITTWLAIFGSRDCDQSGISAMELVVALRTLAATQRQALELQAEVTELKQRLAEAERCRK